MSHSIEVYKAADGFRFRVKAGNNEIVATSEAYTRRLAAVRGARSLVAGLAAMPADVPVTILDTSAEPPWTPVGKDDQ